MNEAETRKGYTHDEYLSAELTATALTMFFFPHRSKEKETGDPFNLRNFFLNEERLG